MYDVRGFLEEYLKFNLPVRIVFNTVGIYIILHHLFIDLVVFVLRKKPSLRYKAVGMEIVASTGFISIILCQLVYVNCGDGPPPRIHHFLYSIAGYPVAHLSMIIRSWRVICLHWRTVDVPGFHLSSPHFSWFKMSKPLCPRNRDMMWMMRRLWLWHIGAIVVFPLVFISPTIELIAIWIWTFYNWITLAALTLCFAVLAIMSRRIRNRHLNESRALLLLILTALLYNFSGNASWLFLVPLWPPFIVIHSAYTIAWQYVLFVIMIAPTLMAVLRHSEGYSRAKRARGMEDFSWRVGPGKPGEVSWKDPVVDGEDFSGQTMSPLRVDAEDKAVQV